MLVGLRSSLLARRCYNKRSGTKVERTTKAEVIIHDEGRAGQIGATVHPERHQTDVRLYWELKCTTLYREGKLET